jgi:pyruvate dehydrogenase E2 component (dihydrolipoamide acetyltransferase)
MMAVVITMPKFGLTMTEGTISYWATETGNNVKSGEVLFEVETDKISNEIEAPETGVLRHIFIPAGEAAEVGAPLAIIAQENEDISEYLGSEKPPSVDPKENASVEMSALEENVIDECVSSSYIRASPLAKKLVSDQGISLQDVIATGPKGIIVSRDLETLAKKEPSISPLARKYAEKEEVKWEEINQNKRIMLTDVIAEQMKTASSENRETEHNAGSSASPTSVTEQMSGIRKVIAKRMTQSWQQIPHVTIHREVDVTSLLSILSTLSSEYKEKGVKLTLTHFLIKIVAVALREHPALNAWCENNNLTYHQEVNMGVAVSLEAGLVVPVIAKANQQSILQIANSLKDKVEKAKTNQLNVDEMRGGTFTISNLGMMNADGFSPIINPPETGILGVGRIVEKPVFKEEEVVRASMLTLSLSFDHRALDGSEAANFLNTIHYYIEDPLRLIVKG